MQQWVKNQFDLADLLNIYWDFRNDYWQSFHDEEWYALTEDPDAGTRLAAAIFYYHDYERRLEAIKKPIRETPMPTLRYKLYDWLHLDLLRRWDRHPIEAKQKLTDDESELAVDSIAEKADAIVEKLSDELVIQYVLNERDDYDSLLEGFSVPAVIAAAVKENARVLKQRLNRHQAWDKRR